MRVELTSEELDLLTERVDTPPEDWRVDYEGRGMWGRKCLGYTGEHTDAYVTFELAAIIAERTCEGAEPTAEDVREVMFQLGSSVDGMGTGRIVYWPSVRVGEGVEVSA